LSVAAVVLAAGASSRYGTSPPKQVVYLDAVLAALEASAVDEVVVVSGAHPLPVESVHCAEWEKGPGASLRCGVATLSDETEAAIVVLADGPDLDPRAVDRIIEHWHANGDDVVLIANYETGTRFHPVLIPRALWPSTPDQGFKEWQPARFVDCSDLTPPGDVDVSPARS